MKCPACPEMTLSMTNREGIEIDYCPKCRGVWLDRGELDKIIERSMTQIRPAQSAHVQPVQGPQGQPSHHSPGQYPQGQYPQGNHPPGSYRKYDDDDDKHHYGKRRRGLLGDLFDFD